MIKFNVSINLNDCRMANTIDEIVYTLSTGVKPNDFEDFTIKTIIETICKVVDKLEYLSKTFYSRDEEKFQKIYNNLKKTLCQTLNDDIEIIDSYYYNYLTICELSFDIDKETGEVNMTAKVLDEMLFDLFAINGGKVTIYGNVNEQWNKFKNEKINN